MDVDRQQYGVDRYRGCSVSVGAANQTNGVDVGYLISNVDFQTVSRESGTVARIQEHARAGASGTPCTQCTPWAGSDAGSAEVLTKRCE
jgi:hypothetical protein